MGDKLYEDSKTCHFNVFRGAVVGGISGHPPQSKRQIVGTSALGQDGIRGIEFTFHLKHLKNQNKYMKQHFSRGKTS